MEHVAYLLLSLIGLGILIFFHELGHYIVARRVGMTVEVFAIGFGRPLLKWTVRGVAWQMGWIPFGGYVKIKGTESKDGRPLDEIPDGFFGKNQRLNRIKVALAGPLVNFLLAFIFFGIIWLGGGRARPFADSTQIVGFVAPKSALFQEGLRPGDRITHVAGREYRGYLSLLEATAMTSGLVEVRGYKAPKEGETFSEPFSYQVDLGAAMKTPGMGPMQMVFPASYLLSSEPPKDSPIHFSGSPMEGKGVLPGDRLLWIDGTYVYSHSELAQILSKSEALISVERGGSYFLQRVPRLPVVDLHLTDAQRDELMDLRYEQGYHLPLKDLRTLPYTLSPSGEVTAPLHHLAHSLSHTLKAGDKIVAIDGKRISSSADIFEAVQKHAFHIAFQRSAELKKTMSSEGEDGRFEALMDRAAIEKIVEALAQGKTLKTSGDIHLVGPIETKPLTAFAKTPEEREELAAYIEREKERVEGTLSPERRALHLNMLDQQIQMPRLGLVFHDKMAHYNPSPFSAFVNVFSDTWHTLKALVAGPLSPKLMSGPIGIVQVMQGGFSTGWAEGLFWMALISVNLGMLNLLPVPVLDGGHIILAIYELVTGRTISPKTMQRLTIPFAVLLIAFLIWVTLHDIGRLFG